MVMKNIIKNRVAKERTYKDTDMLTCSICGKKMERRHSHDAYPVREESWYDEDENRCCDDCNSQIVMKYRINFGRDGGGFHEKMKSMNYKELITNYQQMFLEKCKNKYPSKHVRIEHRENIISSKNISVDWLTYLPIEEGKIIWSIDDNHTYDSLVVLDYLGKTWSVPYYCNIDSAPVHEQQFNEWIQWLKTGEKPSDVASVVEEHQKTYEHITAVGLAVKCMQYKEYSNSLREVMEKSIKKRYKEGKINREEKDVVIDVIRNVFDKISIRSDMDAQTVLSKNASLIETIKAIKPFDFIGVYQWSGYLQFEREDYVVGDLLSGLPIPKSVELLTDEKLAESDFWGYARENAA